MGKDTDYAFQVCTAVQRLPRCKSPWLASRPRSVAVFVPKHRYFCSLHQSSWRCTRAAPEMYSGFGVPMRLSEMDVGGAFAEFAQKRPGEIQSNSNHCLKFVLIVESSKTMLSCRRRWRIQSAQMYPRQCSGCKLTHTMRAQVQECNNGTKANVPIHFNRVHSQSCYQHFDICSL